MTNAETLVFTMFLIFTGSAVLSTVALFTRQSLLVAYIIVGALLGPWALGWIKNPESMSQTGDIGIIFLLFLLGLHLHPQDLWHMLKKVSWIALVSSVVFFAMGFLVCFAFGYSMVACIIVASAMMFSSTIIGLKLLPTTVLHHQHTGELMISVLLMQDIIAIIVLLVLQACSQAHVTLSSVSMVAISFPCLILVAYIFNRFILFKLLGRFDCVKEYVFLVAIAWCLGMAELAHFMGLSEDIGAFIAGVTIATNPISRYIAESLKPLRDFFLVLFFFSMGARFNFAYWHAVFIPAVLLAAFCLLIKPVVYYFLFFWAKEKKQVSWEVGVRLGQISEFSLLIVYLASSSQLVSQEVSYLVQAATILTFIVSCYWVVLCYPTPLAITDQMRKD
jgi:Kef-type K+ transport system membrane component KefB